MTDSGDNLLCRQAESYYYDFLGGQSCEPVPELLAEHIGCCRYCNEQLDRLKKTLSRAEVSDPEQKQNRAVINEMLERHFAYIATSVTCNTVKPFLPGLLDETVQFAIPTPITVHVDNCRDCRQDLETLRDLALDGEQLRALEQIFDGKSATHTQQLYSAVESIIERPQSEVATVYTIDKSAEAKVTGESVGLYDGFPIKIKVEEREERAKVAASAKIIEFASVVKSRVSGVNLRPLLKTAVAAVAVILIVSALFMSTSTAGAVSLEQVYKAIERIKNVYIASFAPDENVYIAGFAPDQTEPFQQIWVSKTLNIYMTKTGDEYVLYDIGNGIRKTKTLGTGAPATGLLTGEAAAGIEIKMSGSLGLMPFYNISRIPADAKWSHITDEGMEAAAEGIEVYELKWIKKAHEGSGVFRKCRFFVDPQTNLLRRIEVYQQLTPNSRYTLTAVRLIEYPDENEIRDVLGEVSF
ncbi:MAG: hypothetical protein ACYS9Y_14505 [Planctomycetota bacterium]